MGAGADRVAAIESGARFAVILGPGGEKLPQERLFWRSALAVKAVGSIAFGKPKRWPPRADRGARRKICRPSAAPGLHDMATGRLLLIDGPGSDSLVVPLSYGRVRIVQRLPRVLVSHVRLRPGSSGGVSVLDATLADERGQVVAEIEGYVVKAVDPRVLKTGRKSESRSPLERWVEQGILPDEGFDVLGRILGQTHEAQVLVSPLDLHAMIAELRPPTRTRRRARGLRPRVHRSRALSTDAPRAEIARSAWPGCGASSSASSGRIARCVLRSGRALADCAAAVREDSQDVGVDYAGHPFGAPTVGGARGGGPHPARADPRSRRRRHRRAAHGRRPSTCRRVAPVLIKKGARGGRSYCVHARGGTS